MIKPTLYVGNATYLKSTNEQMVIQMQNSNETNLVPIEDIDLVIRDHPQISITQGRDFHIPSRFSKPGTYG
jgi:CRISPR-associated protein Cas1